MERKENNTCSSADKIAEMSEECKERMRKRREALKAKRRIYTAQQIRQDLATYDHQVQTSLGFEVDYFPSLELEDLYSMITPTDTNSKETRECAQLALDNFNKDNDSNYRLGDVLKATTNAAGQEVLRITFEGKDDNGDCKIFRGVVFDGIPDKEGKPDRKFMSCVIKPVTTTEKFENMCYKMGIEDGLRHIQNYGVCEEKNYSSESDRLASSVRRMKIDGYEAFTMETATEERIIEAIRKAPIIGGFKFPKAEIQDIKKVTTEIYGGDSTEEDVEYVKHAVLIVGYGFEKGGLYFLVKNCWGEQWGLRGFGKLSSEIFLKFAFPIKPFFTDPKVASTSGR